LNQYKVRVHMLGLLGFFTQADHYEDFELESDETLGIFAKRLAQDGFHDESRGRWIMPGAIAWVEPRN
jgi:hypothetical protein